MSSPAQVRIYYTLTDRVPPDLWPRYFEFLKPDERRRHDRFLLEHSRNEFALGRALLRAVLSNELARTPADIEFCIDPNGKPSVVAQPTLQFNLSHTRGLVACAVTSNEAIGVDVEVRDSDASRLKFAERFFSPDELHWLARQPADEKSDAFYKLWTLKESYIKANGQGMRIPLSEFAFHFSPLPPEVIRIEFAPSINDNSSNWRFWYFEPTLLHSLAAAVRVDSDGTPEFSCSEIIPFHKPRGM